MPRLPPPPSSLFLLVCCFSVILLAAAAESSSSASAACKSTLYPKLCRSILSTITFSPSDPYNYGKFSIKQCLKQARKLSKALDQFLHRTKGSFSSSSSEANAFEDCRQLSDLNVDYLEAISTELKSAESLNEELVDKVQTLLSGIVTNQQTCYDGLVVAKSTIVNPSTSPLSLAFSNTTQLYSVSLGLVTHSLARNLKKKHKKRNGLVTVGRKIREPLETFIEVRTYVILCLLFH